MREDVGTNPDTCLACASKPGIWELYLKWSGGLVGDPPAPVADVFVGKICDECKQIGMDEAYPSQKRDGEGAGR